MIQQPVSFLKRDVVPPGQAVPSLKVLNHAVERLFPRLHARESPIGVVGLGYVGLPLACLLARSFRVVGMDIDERRISELTRGFDRTKEVDEPGQLLNENLTFSGSPKDLAKCPLIIVAVPTPVDEGRAPDLAPLIAASKAVGRVLQEGTVVVFESTVYPGLTEAVCGKFLAQESGLASGRDFFLGYSPERVNPGDKGHTIEHSVKIVAGQTPEVTELLAKVYGTIVPAGIHRAPSIAAAEAAKVFENTQRDLNIALVNEMAMLFDRIGLDTHDVLDAARTKFNFMDVRPGLVGGHCISVDPYYLTYLADTVGFPTQLIRAGRNINDSMSAFIAQKTVSLVMNSQAAPTKKLHIAILGVSFKEDVPDLRNSKVPGIADHLERFGATVSLFDPVVDAAEFAHEFRRPLASSWDDIPPCDAIILAVKHAVFLRDYPLTRLAAKFAGDKLLIDVKGAVDRAEAAKLGCRTWRP